MTRVQHQERSSRTNQNLQNRDESSCLLHQVGEEVEHSNCARPGRGREVEQSRLCSTSLSTCQPSISRVEQSHLLHQVGREVEHSCLLHRMWS
ncbi:unnamed protein product [Gadus morhua 'NCC']